MVAVPARGGAQPVDDPALPRLVPPAGNGSRSSWSLPAVDSCQSHAKGLPASTSHTGEARRTRAFLVNDPPTRALSNESTRGVDPKVGELVTSLLERSSILWESERYSVSLVSTVSLYELQIPLMRPYEISYLSYEHFPLLVAAVTLESGETSFGETRLAVGDQYSWEPPQDPWQICEEVGATLIGASPREGIQRLQARQDSSFRSLTPLATALDNLLEPIAHHSLQRTPLTATVAGATWSELEHSVDHHVAEGYSVFKLKIGFNPANDAARTSFVYGRLPGDCALRVDANMAWDLEAASEYLDLVNKNSVRLQALEQPFPVGQWDDLGTLGRASQAPLMLDESITDLSSIDRAASTPGIKWIKLKLLRAGSPSRLRQLVARAHDRGLRVTVGNGTGSDLGCLLEARAVVGCVKEACEFNGFLKTKVQLLTDPMNCSQGSLLVDPTADIRLDEASVRKVLVRELTLS